MFEIRDKSEDLVQFQKDARESFTLVKSMHSIGPSIYSLIVNALLDQIKL